MVNVDFIPRVNSKGNNILILKMDTTSQEINRSLRSAIRANSEGHMFHSRNGSHTGRNNHEPGLAGFLQERQRSLENPHHARGIDVEMLHEVRRLHVGHFLESGKFEDASVGDDDVDFVDAMAGEGSDRFAGLRVGCALDLHDVQFAAFGCGELVQSFGVRVGGLTDGGDDGVAGTGEVLFHETLADAWGKRLVRLRRSLGRLVRWGYLCWRL